MTPEEFDSLTAERDKYHAQAQDLERGLQAVLDYCDFNAGIRDQTTPRWEAFWSVAKRLREALNSASRSGDVTPGGADLPARHSKALEALLVFVQLHAPTPENSRRHDEDERGWNMALSGAVQMALRVLLQSEHAATVRETVAQARWEHLLRKEGEL